MVLVTKEIMTMDAALCFIDAANVETPGGKLTDFCVRDALNRDLGRLDGFVLDPGTRRLRFMVVACRRWLRTHKYLLPIRIARLDQIEHAMLVDVDETSPDQLEFDPKALPAFSDEHLLAAMFGSREQA